MKKLTLLLFLIPTFIFAQEHTFKSGIPDDLDTEKIIFLEHEKVDVSANPKNGKAEKYLYKRQIAHNKLITEANTKLRGAALSYPYSYAIASPSSYKAILAAGYKYVLQSSAYLYETLQGQPEEGELLVHEYYIHDVENDIAYKVFELDEMKVYDFKLVIKKLKKAIK